MNRRRFVAYVGSLASLWIAPAIASDDEVGSPVELCPCCCSNDDGVTFYSCDGYGNPLEGDHANCASLNKDTYVDDEHELEPEDWSRVALPNTGGR